jgi:hypothetical protein
MYFQAIILLIKINKNWFLKEEKISFQNLFFINFKITGESTKEKRKRSGRHDERAKNLFYLVYPYYMNFFHNIF